MTEVFGREELNRPIDSEKLQDLFSKKEQRMTKEELKKEAEESAKKFFGKPTDLVDLDNLRIFKNGYLAGAEPREKRIEELEDTEIVNKAFKQQIKVLEKENAEMKDSLEDLQEQNSHMFNVITLQEQQIEKMKADVKQEQSYWNSGEMQYNLYQRLLDKWEIKEND